jgi:hypothetical protein
MDAAKDIHKEMLSIWQHFFVDNLCKEFVLFNKTSYLAGKISCLLSGCT